MSVENIKLAYGMITTIPSKNGYIGAILITDFKGFPLEFRYTDPIYPTKIQQTLYGSGLDKYIKVDVILDSLIKVFSHKLQVLIVQDDDLLQYKSDTTVIVRVSSTKTPPLSATGEISKVKNSEYLIQTSHSSSPIRLQFSSYFEIELEKLDSIIKLLLEAGNFIDIDEPLNRVGKTIDLVCNQEI